MQFGTANSFAVLAGSGITNTGPTTLSGTNGANIGSSPAETFSYEVVKFKVVKRTDKTVIVPTDDGTLTLTTCYPFNHIGVTTDAFIVSAKLVP